MLEPVSVIVQPAEGLVLEVVNTFCEAPLGFDVVVLTYVLSMLRMKYVPSEFFSKRKSMLAL